MVLLVTSIIMACTGVFCTILGLLARPVPKSRLYADDFDTYASPLYVPVRPAQETTPVENRAEKPPTTERPKRGRILLIDD